MKREDLKDFHEIMKVTGKRDDFIIRPLEYFQKMYDELGKDHVKLLIVYYEDKPISRNIWYRLWKQSMVFIWCK